MVYVNKQIVKTRWEPGKKNPIAPLPRSSSLLTLPQGSFATPQHVAARCATAGIKSKSWLNHTSDYDSNAIVVIFFGKSKIFQRKKLGNPGTKSTILVVQTASEPVIPLPRVLKAAKAGPAPRVNLVGTPVLIPSENKHCKGRTRLSVRKKSRSETMVPRNVLWLVK